MKKQVLRLLASLNNYGLLRGAALFAKTEFRLSGHIKPPGVKHPIHLRPHTSDFPTFQQVFLDREYKINFTDPKVIFDCGANIGLFAVYMKTLFPDARIVCIEPDPENFAQVKKNLAGYEGVYFENCGIWNKDTKLKVYDKYNSGKWAMVVEEDLEEGNIPAVSIQSLMKKYGVERIDVLKMDIETSEKQVFSDNYEAWLPKVKNIVIEFHDFLLDGCSKSFFKAINRCIGNYEFLAKGENVIIRNKDLT